MKKQLLRRPPVGAPEGTFWFGGPVDRFKITLRVRGEDLVPDDVSSLLQCAPTGAKHGRWSLQLESTECSPTDDVEDGIKRLLARLPSDSGVWASLTTRYEVDLFCGLFLASANRGFELSPQVMKLLADRGIEVGFDIYFDP
jgi:hypothetical protein